MEVSNFLKYKLISFLTQFTTNKYSATNIVAQKPNVLK